MSPHIFYEEEVLHYGGVGHLHLQIAESDGNVGIGLALNPEGSDLRMCSLTVDQAKEVRRALDDAISQAEG
jgi:hypothetical protein